VDDVTLSSAVILDQVEITAQGSIYDNNDAGGNDVVSTGSSILEAQTGTIGQAANPLEVSVGGTLSVGAGGTEGGLLSVVINGTTIDGLIHILDQPQGFVLFNNRIFGASPELMRDYYQAAIPTSVDEAISANSLLTGVPFFGNDLGYPQADIFQPVTNIENLVAPASVQRFIDVRVLN
jgi:hypothetical protein